MTSKWVKGTIRLDTADGGVDVPAFLNGGLAVHKRYSAPDIETKTYLVSHVLSGRRVFDSGPAGVQRMKRVAEAILPLAPWEATEREVMNALRENPRKVIDVGREVE
jgi:hypothetical protein